MELHGVLWNFLCEGFSGLPAKFTALLERNQLKLCVKPLLETPTGTFVPNLLLQLGHFIWKFDCNLLHRTLLLSQNHLGRLSRTSWNPKDRCPRPQQNRNSKGPNLQLLGKSMALSKDQNADLYVDISCEKKTLDKGNFQITRNWGKYVCRSATLRTHMARLFVTVLGRAVIFRGKNNYMLKLLEENEDSRDVYHKVEKKS